MKSCRHGSSLSGRDQVQQKTPENLFSIPRRQFFNLNGSKLTWVKMMRLCVHSFWMVNVTGVPPALSRIEARAATYQPRKSISLMPKRRCAGHLRRTAWPRHYHRGSKSHLILYHRLLLGLALTGIPSQQAKRHGQHPPVHPPAFTKVTLAMVHYIGLTARISAKMWQSKRAKISQGLRRTEVI